MERRGFLKLVGLFATAAAVDPAPLLADVGLGDPEPVALSVAGPREPLEFVRYAGPWIKLDRHEFELTRAELVQLPAENNRDRLGRSWRVPERPEIRFNFLSTEHPDQHRWVNSLFGHRVRFELRHTALEPGVRGFAFLRSVSVVNVTDGQVELSAWATVSSLEAAS